MNELVLTIIHGLLAGLRESIPDHSRSKIDKNKFTTWRKLSLMEVKKYFNEITEKINNMSDEEFIAVLKDIGLEQCPSDKDHN